VAIAALVLALFGGLLVSIEIGRRVGLRRLAKPSAGAGGEAAASGFGVMEGAVFALLGLLLAFSFSAAAARFDKRRELIVAEANAIGTAYLRLDLLPAGPRASLRQTFGRYLDARLGVYRHIGWLGKGWGIEPEDTARAAALQNEIWAQLMAACRLADTPAVPMLLVPAVNEMFDITTTRRAALGAHTPTLILLLLVVLALACAVLAGHGMASVESRSWIHVLSFAGILGVSIYVIMDYEFPRHGLIRVDKWDQLLVDLRSMMP